MQEFNELVLSDTPVSTPETGYPAKASQVDFNDVATVSQGDGKITIEIDEALLSEAVIGYKAIDKDGKVGKLTFATKLMEAKNLFTITQAVLYQGVKKEITFNCSIGGWGGVYIGAKPAFARTFTAEELAAQDAAAIAATS